MLRELRAGAARSPFVWWNRLHVHSAPAINLATATRRQDLIGAVATVFAEVQRDPDARTRLIEQLPAWAIGALRDPPPLDATGVLEDAVAIALERLGAGEDPEESA